DALGAEIRDDGAEDLGRIGGNRADHHLLRAALDPGPGIGHRTDAAADLHAIAPRDAAHDLRRDRSAAARAFEVDHVQARSVVDAEIEQDVLRIAVDGHLPEVAASQADHFAFEKIDRRDHVHAMKFLNTSRPAPDDFSGWNWTPKTRPFCTAAVNEPP